MSRVLGGSTAGPARSSCAFSGSARGRTATEESEGPNRGVSPRAGYQTGPRQPALFPCPVAFLLSNLLGFGVFRVTRSSMKEWTPVLPASQPASIKQSYFLEV